MKAVLLFSLVALTACPGPKYGSPLMSIKGPPPKIFGRQNDPATAAHMSTIATLRDRAVGPFLARGDAGALAVYVSGVRSGATRPVVAIPLAKDGSPDAQARVIAEAAPDTSTLVVRRVDAGYLVAWTSLTDRGESLSLVGVGDDGAPRARAIELSRTTGHIVWVETVKTSRGAVCVWADEGPTGGADVLAQALDASGRPRGVPSRVSRGASSWQAVANGEGIALGVVSSGELAVIGLDADARVVSGPTPIARNVGADMDFVATPKGALVFAWTDRSRMDPALVVAGVDPQRKPIAPHDAIPDVGSSSLVAIQPGASGALLLWENAHKRDRVRRPVRIAEIADASSPVVTRTTLELSGGGVVEARARGDGYGLLVWARACDTSGACAQGAAPTFVRLDASLSVAQSEALVQGPPVSLAWSLDCGKDSCLALAATPDAPTTVYAVDLSERPSPSAAPVQKPLPEDAPRLVTASTLASGAQIADVASVRVGATTLVASLVSELDEKSREPRASLRVVPIANGKPGAAVTLTTHALQTGGIAMTSSGKDALVAYVVKDGSSARVHVARLDDHGVKRGEATLGGRGDASDVSITSVSGGSVVAWVDTRDGNGEVYATKLDASLSPGRETRITSAPGDATDTALVAIGSSVILAWADPRESPRDGFADIYAVALSPRDAHPLAREERILSTAAHSRSPVLAKTTGGAALAWIEEAPVGAASQEARGAMFALLDEKAHPVREPAKLQLRDEGVVTAITLDAGDSGRLVHAIAARSAHDELSLDAVRIPIDEGGAVDSYPLLVLDGPSSMDEALALHGDELLFSDDGPDASDARLRRAALDWRK
ncbi:MAG TPA: hypothetical protein VGH28_24000 [Polyangiaceae bacterium]